MAQTLLRKWPYLVKHKAAACPGEVSVKDINHLKTEEGVMCLNTLTDAFSPTIVGDAFAGRLNATSVIKAHEMALKQRRNPQTPIN